MSPRLQNAGLAVLLLVVAGLIASAVMGVVGKPGPAAAPAARTPAGAVPEPTPNRPKVEVLNATGRSGLAKVVTRYLRDRGFDVVYFGNAGPGSTATRVVLRGQDTLAARRVADTLRIATVVRQPDPTAFLEATVVLGRGWTLPAVDTLLPGPRDSVPPPDSAARTAARRPAAAPATRPRAPATPAAPRH